MKKSIITLLLGLCSSVTWAGPVAEIYTCELNEGKTLVDVNNMMSDFSQMLKKAGLQDAYTVYVGFQQLPIRHNSVNWIGIAPSGEAFGKITDWFNGSEDGAAFGALYTSIYTCDHSFLTHITATSN
jgi:hypothetical protein